MQAVVSERNRPGEMSLVLFDVLYVGGRSFMREPWRDRRKRLEDLVEGRQLPRIAVVPVTEDAATLYETWVGMGGEGIVMLHLTYKHPRTGKRVEIRQAVRIARQQPFELNVGARASVVCWGVMPSGMLRHPLFLAWL